MVPRRPDSTGGAMAKQVPKEYRKLVKEAVRQGWRLEETKKGFRLLAPNGVGAVTIDTTESDKRRAFRNTVSRMRQHGFVWEGH
jgi:hypothetical protein